MRRQRVRATGLCKDIARDRIKRERATDENAEDDVLARAAFA